MSSLTPSIPDRIDRFEVRRRLGAGSFAAVYLAYDPSLDTEVALKVLGDHHAADLDVRERFVREARVLRKLRSDRIVTIHDIGEWDGRPYLVMEAVDGGTLASRLAEPVTDVMDLVRLIDELAACLAPVHEAGIVHRDITPANVLVRNDGPRPSTGEVPRSLIGHDEHLVLTDFGLARAAELTNLTVAGGTDGYLAPEQRLPSTTIDHRADLYAATALVARARHGPGFHPERLEQLSADKTWRAVLDRGMAADVDRRFESAEEWAENLTDALGIPVGSAPGDRRSVLVEADAVPRAGSKMQRPLLAVGIGAVAMVLIGILILLAADDENTAATEQSQSEQSQSEQSQSETLGVDPAATVASTADAAENEVTASQVDNWPGPQIIGPDSLLIGEKATYLHEDVPFSSYVWLDPFGVETEGDSITVTPTRPGDLVVTLTENHQGTITTSKLTIRVRTQ